MRNRSLVALTIIGLLGWLASPLVAGEVPINPITKDVKDKIKESVQLVNSVDDQVAPKVKELEKTLKLYEPCEGRDDDRGCVELKKQIGEKYSAVLNSLGDAVPRMQKAINATAQGLGKSIQAKTRTKNVKELYRNISKKQHAPRVRGPLSKKLSQLLSALGTSGNQSILEMSLQTQADLISASDTLAFLESKISHLSLMVDLGQELPILSEEMASVMRGVSELFGYDMAYIPEIEDVTGPAVSMEPDDWRQ